MQQAGKAAIHSKCSVHRVFAEQSPVLDNIKTVARYTFLVARLGSCFFLAVCRSLFSVAAGCAAYIDA